MKIKADAIRAIGQFKLFAEYFFPVFNVNIIFPEWNCRVTGVPWNRNVIFMQQGRWNIH